MGVHRVLLTGSAGAGKTSLLKAISDIPIVSAEKRMIGTHRHRSLEYGRYYAHPAMVYLYAFDLLFDEDGLDWLTYFRGEMSALLLIIDGIHAGPESAVGQFRDVQPVWTSHLGAAVMKLDADDYRQDTVEALKAVAPGRVWMLYHDRVFARTFAADFATRLEKWSRA